MRYDDTSKDFYTLNKTLWNLGTIDIDSISESLSIKDYLEGLGMSEEMIALASAGYANTFGTNIEELSLKQCAKMTNYWDHTDYDCEGGDYRFKKSYGPFIDFLSKGMDIRLNTPISEINYTEDSIVRLYASDGRVFSTKRLVVTSSIHVLKKESKILDFNPPLPPEKIEALDCVNMHTAVKIILKFRERPWPEGLNGMIMADCLIPEAWFKEVDPRIFNKDDPSDDNHSAYLATGFCCARFAAEAMSLGDEELKAQFLAQLEDVFSKMTVEHMSADGMSSTPQLTTLLSSESFATSSASSDPISDAVFSDASLGGSDDAESAFSDNDVFSCATTVEEQDSFNSGLVSPVHCTKKDSCENVFRIGTNPVVVNSASVGLLPSASSVDSLKPLPKASSVFVDGLVYDWAQKHPYIGGGYASPKAGKGVNWNHILAKPIKNRVFFAGEATHHGAGGTAHAALDTGIRAAAEVFATFA